MYAYFFVEGVGVRRTALSCRLLDHNVRNTWWLFPSRKFLYVPRGYLICAHITASEPLWGVTRTMRANTRRKVETTARVRYIYLCTNCPNWALFSYNATWFSVRFSNWKPCVHFALVLITVARKARVLRALVMKAVILKRFY